MIIRKLQEKDIPEVESIYDLYWSDGFRENLSRKLISSRLSDKKISDLAAKYFKKNLVS